MLKYSSSLNIILLVQTVKTTGEYFGIHKVVSVSVDQKSFVVSPKLWCSGDHWGWQAVDPVKSVQSFTSDLNITCSNLFYFCKLAGWERVGVHLKEICSIAESTFLTVLFTSVNMNDSLSSEHLYSGQGTAGCLSSDLLWSHLFHLLNFTVSWLQLNQKYINIDLKSFPFCTCGIVAMVVVY